MSFFADTSAWSVALQHDTPSDHPAVTRLGDALARGEHAAGPVVVTATT